MVKTLPVQYQVYELDVPKTKLKPGDGRRLPWRPLSAVHWLNTDIHELAEKMYRIDKSVCGTGEWVRPWQELANSNYLTRYQHPSIYLQSTCSAAFAYMPAAMSVMPYVPTSECNIFQTTNVLVE